MILPPSEIAKLAYKAGFRGDALNIAVAIALAESGGDTNAYNPETAAGTPRGSGSRGLWQIYGVAHPQYNNDSAFNPEINARAAYQVFREAGNRFTPWSTYNQGMANPTQNWAAQAGSGIANMARTLTGQPAKNNRNTVRTTTTTTRGGGLAGQLQNINATAGGKEESPEGIPGQIVNAVTGGRDAYDLLFIGLGSALIIIATIALIYTLNIKGGQVVAENADKIAALAV